MRWLQLLLLLQYFSELQLFVLLWFQEFNGTQIFLSVFGQLDARRFLLLWLVQEEALVKKKQVADQ